MIELTQRQLKELLTYNPISGLFRWNEKGSGRKLDRLAGGLSNGYLSILIDLKPYYAHRLAWLYMTGNWPKNQIDHKDHDKTNNSFSNLRDVKPQQNSKNMVRNKNNKSGATGISWHKPTSKWRVEIHVDGKSNHLGLFDNPLDALAARRSAENKYNFYNNHGDQVIKP